MAVIATVFLFVSPLVLAWDSDLKIPAPAPVVDEFGLLSSQETLNLDSLFRQIKQKSGVEIALYIPSTLQGREINDFSIAVAEQWKLGRKKEDNGLLLIVAPKERKMRFEVGYGLEGELTDAFTKRVLDNVMRPYFKRGEYYQGILSSIVALQQKVPLGLERQQNFNTYQSDDGPNNLQLFVIIIVVILLLLFRVLAFFMGFRGTNYRGGGGMGSGGSGGGSWGGGGGGFGGGGSSSSW